MKKDSILAALPKLKPDDLKQVHAVAASLLAALGKPADAALSVGYDTGLAIFDALVSAAGVTATMQSLPVSLVQRFDRQWPALVTFLDANFKGWNDNKVSRAAFLRHLFDLIQKEVRVHTKPTPLTMINNMHRLPEVLDKAYPNYLKSGLGHLIISRFKRQ
jgi:hypothetical protein